jgi:exopolyphosphatase/guanosine-5'-triphosphate,3'-diphosphate pyrophosphatase
VPERAAVIDVGSNTLHLLVADSEGARLQPVHDLRVHAALGPRVAAGGAVGQARIREVARDVRRFASQARGYGARDVLLIGTHAVRVAADREELIAALEKAAGVPMYVLDPAQEAALCLAGAALDPLPAPPFLLADIGGGSTDIALVGEGGIVAAESVPLGSGVLATACLMDDPPGNVNIRVADAAVRDMIAAARFEGVSTVGEIVATGGAARKLRRQFGATAHARHGYHTSRLLPVIETLLTTPSARWPHPFKDPERSRIIRGGAVIFRQLLLKWQAPAWRVSFYGLREGALAARARGDFPDHLPLLAGEGSVSGNGRHRRAG